MADQKQNDTGHVHNINIDLSAQDDIGPDIPLTDNTQAYDSDANIVFPDATDDQVRNRLTIMLITAQFYGIKRTVLWLPQSRIRSVFRSLTSRQISHYHGKKLVRDFICRPLIFKVRFLLLEYIIW